MSSAVQIRVASAKSEPDAIARLKAFRAFPDIDRMDREIVGLVIRELSQFE